MTKEKECKKGQSELVTAERIAEAFYEANLISEFLRDEALKEMGAQRPEWCYALTVTEDVVFEVVRHDSGWSCTIADQRHDYRVYDIGSHYSHSLTEAFMGAIKDCDSREVVALMLPLWDYIAKKYDNQRREKALEVAARLDLKQFADETVARIESLPDAPDVVDALVAAARWHAYLEPERSDALNRLADDLASTI